MNGAVFVRNGAQAIFFMIGMLFQSCNPELVCIECHNLKRHSLKDIYIKVGSDNQLYLFDYFQNKTTTSRLDNFCDPMSDADKSGYDIFKASAYVYWNCDKKDSLLRIVFIEGEDMCPSNFQLIDKQFDLQDRFWYLTGIEKWVNGIDDWRTDTPCGYGPGMQFNKDGIYQLKMILNGTSASYSFVGADSIKLEQGFMTTVNVKTSYQQAFEKYFSEAVEGLTSSNATSQTFKFDIDKNHLTLTARHNDAKIYLMCKD